MQNNYDPNMETGNIGNSNFQFSGIRVEQLGASEITLATVGVDVTGSTIDFAKELHKCVVAAVESLKKSPRSENILVRVFMFSTDLPDSIVEIHGFKPLAEIDTNDYPNFKPEGFTPLYDAVYSAVGATNAYAKKLYDADFLVNAINIVITDGCDNNSSMGATAIQKEIKRAIKEEFLESTVSILVGINTTYYEAELKKFQKSAGIDLYIDAGEVTAQKLAKLQDFVSQSVSSQSQAMGTGGPSQNINPTI